VKSRSNRTAAAVGAEWIRQLTRFMGEEGLRRGLNKEERGKLTLSEIFKDPEGQ
jgi:hypothetical protein